MSLVGFIEKLQKKPRYIRVQIMWAGAIIGAIIIFAFWLWSLTALLAQSTKPEQKKDNVAQSFDEVKKEMPGLWESLSAGISNVVKTVKDDLAASPSFEAELEDGSGLGAEKLPLE